MFKVKITWKDDLEEGIYRTGIFKEMVEKQSDLKSSNEFSKDYSKYKTKDQIMGTLYWCQSKLDEYFLL